MLVRQRSNLSIGNIKSKVVNFDTDIINEPAINVVLSHVEITGISGISDYQINTGLFTLPLKNDELLSINLEKSVLNDYNINAKGEIKLSINDKSVTARYQISNYINNNTLVNFDTPFKNDAIKILQFNHALQNDAESLITHSESVILNYNTLINWDNSITNDYVSSQPGTGVIEPEPPDIIIHEPKDYYLVMNSVAVTHIESGTILRNFFDLRISTDFDSFAWRLNITVDEIFYEMVKPGKPLQTIKVNVNGEEFDFIITDSDDNHTHGLRTFRLTGVSPISIAGKGMDRLRTYKEIEIKTAGQIVTEELSTFGFNVNWDAIDWIIPGGLYSYANQPTLNAVLELTNAIGAVITTTSPTDVSVKSKFPVSPWNWATSQNIDRQISERAMTRISRQYKPVTNPDVIFVIGDNGESIAVKVVKSESSGSEPLNDVVNRYITDIPSATEAGRTAISEASDFIKKTMTTFIDNNGVVKPLELIEFTTLTGNTWRGQSTGVSISCKATGREITQTINVLEYQP